MGLTKEVLRMRMRKEFLLFLVFLFVVPLIIGNYQVPLKLEEANDTLNASPLNNTADLLNYGGFRPNGTAVCTAVNEQHYPQLCSDGAGGVIIVWQDIRSGNYDIYAQRVDAAGTVRWAANGTAICTADGDQTEPQLCSDGAGGAIITWQDSRYPSDTPDIFAQRVDASGMVQWVPNGACIAWTAYAQFHPQLCSDGAGGAIITWEDNRLLAHKSIWAVRLDASGWLVWGFMPSQRLICEMGALPQICSDGAGGAIITYQSAPYNSDIYAQRIDASGAVRWGAGGTAICTASDEQQRPQLCSDGAGGAIITWGDSRSGAFDIYAQRIDANGITNWTANGTAVCTAGNNQENPQLCSDGAGGAIIVWPDYRSGLGDIYAQRVDASSIGKWVANGTAVCTAGDNQVNPQLCSDGAGGAIIIWGDSRSGCSDIYAQWVDGAGTVEWAANGTAVCTVGGDQTYPQLVNDGLGGFIITWSDSRSGPADIYCSDIDYLYISLDSIAAGMPNNIFNQQQLYIANDGKYHQVNSTYDGVQQNVSIQYSYQVRGLNPSFPYFIQNMTINLVYAAPTLITDPSTAINHRMILDIYNVSSETWSNVADKGSLINDQNFQFILANGLYHYFNNSELLLRVQILDIQSSSGFTFKLDQLMISYKTDSHLRIIQHLENGLLSPPGVLQVSESADLNVTLKFRTWIGDSYNTLANISFSYRINAGSWSSLSTVPVEGLGTVNFIIGEGNYSKGDDIYYYITIVQYYPPPYPNKTYFWTQGGLKSDENAAKLEAFHKRACPVPYRLTLNYSLWFKAQVETTLSFEDGPDETIYPMQRITSRNITIDFYNSTVDLGIYDVISPSEPYLNHIFYEQTGNISKPADPTFDLVQGIKCPFLLPLNLNLINFSSTILMPEIALAEQTNTSSVIYLPTPLNLTYKGVSTNWPVSAHHVLEFGSDNATVRFDTFTGIMVYYEYEDNTPNASSRLILALTWNNQTYPSNLEIDKRLEAVDSGTCILDAQLLAILYDPPGDMSFSMIESGTTWTTRFSVQNTTTHGGFLEAKVIAFTVGAGVNIKDDHVEYDETTAEAEITFTSSMTSSLDSENPELIGPGRGDLYYGTSIIVEYYVMVENHYIVIGAPDIFRAPAANDIKVWERGSHIEYGLNLSSDFSVLGAYLDTYNLSHLQDYNIFADNEITPDESPYVEELAGSPYLWTPATITEYGYAHTTSTTWTTQITTEFDLEAFLAWDIEYSQGMFVSWKAFKSEGRIGYHYNLLKETIDSSSTEETKEIRCHLQDDDGMPIGEQDQFLVNIYKDLRWGTFGFTFEGNFTYTSGPYEYGTRDHRSPTESSILQIADYLHGTALINCCAADEETGIAFVRLYYDNIPIYDEDSRNFIGAQTTPTASKIYQITWNTQNPPLHGTYYIFVVTYDNGFPLQNEKVSIPYMVQIDNVLPISCQIRAYGPYSGAINLYTNAFDADSGIDYVEYWDGHPDNSGSILLGSSREASSSFNFIWSTDPGGTDDGTHNLYSKAYDRAGNYLISASLDLLINNTIDTETPIEPLDITPLCVSIIVGCIAIAAAIVTYGFLRWKAVQPPPLPPKKVQAKMSPSAEQTPLILLKQRLAQGEITPEDYQVKKKLLEE